MNLTRRSFMGSLLAAAVAPAFVRSGLLMRMVSREKLVLPLVQSRVALPMMYSGRIDTYVSYIDTTTCLDTAIQSVMGMLRYTARDVEVLLPDGVVPSAIYIDDRPITLKDVRGVIEHPVNGVSVLRIRDLDLSDYGHRLPTFTMDI